MFMWGYEEVIINVLGCVLLCHAQEWCVCGCVCVGVRVHWVCVRACACGEMLTESVCVLIGVVSVAWQPVAQITSLC